MGHSTTVYGGVSEYLAEGFIEHPQWGQFRRIESVIWFALRRGHPWYIAHPAKNPHPGGTAIATSHSTANVIPDIPPWIPDHVAARRKNQAATPVRTPTIPDTVEAMARRISLLSAGEGLAIAPPFSQPHPAPARRPPLRAAPLALYQRPASRRQP
jgi:hypothetical protein